MGCGWSSKTTKKLPTGNPRKKKQTDSEAKTAKTESQGTEGGEKGPSDDSEDASVASAKDDSAKDDSEMEKEDESADSATDTSTEADANKKPAVQPFEEVRDQVARSMVEHNARLALDKAITAVRNRMKAYYEQTAIGGPDADPQRPDLKQLGEEQGLDYRMIGPFDPVKLSDEPIADSVQEGTEFSRRGVPFSAMMFGVEGQVPKQPVFRPVVSVDLEAQKSYLTWKVEETEAFTPELDEARDEVIRFIRSTKAREIAKKAAEELASKANSGQSLESLVPEDKKDNYKKDITPFTWLNTVGFSGVSLGNVPELDSVGEEFMKAVFTKLGEKHVVAENLPGRVVYVIERNEFQPALVDLQSIFAQPTERLLPRFMNDGAATKVREGFYKAIDEKTNFSFVEDPAE